MLRHLLLPATTTVVGTQQLRQSSGVREKPLWAGVETSAQPPRLHALRYLLQDKVRWARRAKERRRRPVDAHDAKFRAVPRSQLGVVAERPVEVSSDGYPVAARRRHRHEVLHDERGAQGVRAVGYAVLSHDYGQAKLLVGVPEGAVEVRGVDRRARVPNLHVRDHSVLRRWREARTHRR